MDEIVAGGKEVDCSSRNYGQKNGIMCQSIYQKMEG